MCSRGAFVSESKNFVEKDLETSVAGRSFMITGANSGIGKAAAMAIAKKGAFVMRANIAVTLNHVFLSDYLFCRGKKSILLSVFDYEYNFLILLYIQVVQSTWSAETKTKQKKPELRLSKILETKYVCVFVKDFWLMINIQCTSWADKPKVVEPNSYNLCTTIYLCSSGTKPYWNASRFYLHAKYIFTCWMFW